MPVVPNLPMPGGPPAPVQPTLERGRSGRIDVSGVASGVSRLGDVAGRAVQIGRAPESLGQGAARGLMAIGQGVRDLGEAQERIAFEIQKAKNYADLHEAGMAMRREMAEFETFMVDADPSEWQTAWQQRVEKFPGRYLSGKDLAPEVQDAITQKVLSQGELFGYEIATQAKRATVSKAREAFLAEAAEAVARRDPAEIEALYESDEAKLWLPQDQRVVGKIRALEQIKQEQAQEAVRLADAYAMQGDGSTARAILDQSRDNFEPGEYELRTAELETKTQVGIEMQEFLDRRASGEDPARLMEEYSQKDADGNFVTATHLPMSERAKILQTLQRDMAEEEKATVAKIKQDIDIGIDPRQLAERDDFKSLPEQTRRLVTDYAAQGALNDSAEFATMLREVRNYDPTEDPTGAQRANIEERMALRFSDNRYRQLAEELETANTRQEPVGAMSRVASDFFASLQRRFEEGEVGGFRIDTNEISVRKDANGVEVYTVPDPNGQEFPGFLGTYRGRVIELSEKDKIDFEAGRLRDKTVVDRKAKEAAFSRFLSAQDEIERRIKAGELTTAEDIQRAANSILGDVIEIDVERRLFDSGGRELPSGSFGTPSGALFPPVANPEEEIKWLESLEVGTNF